MDHRLIGILKDIKDKEYSLRNYKTYPQWDGTVRTQASFSDPDRRLGAFLLVLFHMKGYLSDERYENEDGIREELECNVPKEKHEVLQAWDKLKKSIPYVVEINNYISSFSLSNYNESVDLSLVQWMVSNNILASFDYELSSGIHSSYDLVQKTRDALDLSHTFNDILVIDGKGLKIIANRLIASFVPGQRIVFTGFEKPIWDLVIIKHLVDDFSNLVLLPSQVDTLCERVGEETFDAVYFTTIWSGEKEKKTTLKVEELVPFVKPEGLLFACQQDRESISSWGKDVFLKYQIPFVFEGPYSLDSIIVVLCKREDKKSKIRYIIIESGPYAPTSEELSSEVLSAQDSNLLLHLTKDDFLYAKRIDYAELKRPKGQEKFFWRHIDEVLEEDTDLKFLPFIPKDETIVSWSHFSSDPFDCYLDPKYQLPTSNETDDEMARLINDGFKLEKDGGFRITKNEKYVQYFKEAFDNVHERTEDGKEFAKLLTLRLLDHDALLRCYGKYLLIQATPEHPVCIRLFDIGRDDDGIWGVWGKMEVFKVRDGNDPNFIVYQLIHKKNENHFLVASSLREQVQFHKSVFEATFWDTSREYAKMVNVSKRLGYEVPKEAEMKIDTSVAPIKVAAIFSDSYIAPGLAQAFLLDYNQDPLLKYTCHLVDDANTISAIKERLGIAKYDFCRHIKLLQESFENLCSLHPDVPVFITDKIKAYLYAQKDSQYTRQNECFLNENWNSDEIRAWATEHSGIIPNPDDAIAEMQENEGYRLLYPFRSPINDKMVTSFSSLVLYFKSLFHIRRENNLRCILAHINKKGYGKFKPCEEEISISYGRMDDNEVLFTDVDRLLLAYEYILKICKEAHKDKSERPHVEVEFMKDGGRLCFSIRHINSEYRKSVDDTVKRIGQQQTNLIDHYINGICDLYLQADFGDEGFYEVNLHDGKPREKKRMDYMKGVKYILKF